MILFADRVNRSVFEKGLYAEVKPCCGQYNGSNSISYVADNGVLDINRATSTFCFCLKIKVTDITHIGYIGGKNVFGNKVGRYGFRQNGATLETYIETSTGTKIGSYSNALTANSIYLITLKIDILNSNYFVYKNEELLNAEGTSFDGTFSALENKYKFILGAGNNLAGSDFTHFGEVDIFESRIFHTDIVTSLRDIMDGNLIGNEIFYTVVSGKGLYSYDVIGVLNLTNTNVSKVYSKESSIYPIKLGWSLFQKDELFEYVPYGANTTAIEAAGYELIQQFIGGIPKYNMWDALVCFDPTGSLDDKLAVFDKSNATIHIATGEMDYYDSSNVYDWTVDEVSNSTIYLGYFNAEYNKRLLVKVTKNGSRIISIDEIFNFAVELSTVDYNKALIYCEIE